MRRFIKLLSPLLLAALFISCAQSVNQNGSISFDGGKIVSRAVQYSINKSQSPETGGDEEEFTPEMEEALKAALEFTATLSMDIKSSNNSYQDSVKEEYTVDYSKAAVFEKKKITFQNVPVGIKAIINATITTKLAIKDESALLQLFELMDMPMEEFADFPAEELTEKLATAFDWGFTLYGKSELTVHEGENPVTLKMSYDPNGNGEGGEGGGEDIPVDGTIDIEKPVKLTITIDQEKSDSKYYLNKGKIFFTLLDEDGNNLLTNQENSRVDWTYKLTLRNTEIPKSGASGLRYEANESVGSFEIKDMPAAGNYQLYVQAQKFDNGTYSPSAPTSAVFDLPVDGSNFYSFNAASFIVDNDVCTDFENILQTTSSDVTIKISGETTETYNGVLQAISRATLNFNYYINLDLYNMTTTSASRLGNSSNTTEWTALSSIVLPDDLIEINNEFFLGCTNLKSVTFGSKIQKISEASTFAGCTNLSSVYIPENAPLVLIHDNSFLNCSSLRTLKLPASFVMLGANALPASLEELVLEDESGTWCYLENSNDFNNGMNDILDGNTSFVTEYTLESLCTEVPDYTISQKLLYAFKNHPEYYFYCIK